MWHKWKDVRRQHAPEVEERIRQEVLAADPARQPVAPVEEQDQQDQPGREDAEQP